MRIPLKSLTFASLVPAFHCAEQNHTPSNNLAGFFVRTITQVGPDHQSRLASIQSQTGTVEALTRQAVWNISVVNNFAKYIISEKTRVKLTENCYMPLFR